MSRFTPEVESVLRTAGWAPGRRLEQEAVAAMHMAVTGHTGQFGGQLRRTSFADPILEEFGGLTIHSGLPGVDLQPRPFTLDPALAGWRVETLIDFGRALGVGVYPLGVEGVDDAVLAVTDLGSVLAVDHTGEWFLGGSIEASLDLLVTGRRPRPVAPGDGRVPPPWQPPAPASATAELQPLGSLKRPVGAAFFLPRTPANLHYVWLPDVLVRMGIVPTASPINPGRFEVTDWGGLACEVHVLDLEWYTVLVLAFEARAVLRQEPERPSDLPEPMPVLSPLAQAFRLACIGLAPELEVAFVQTVLVPDLLRLVADREQEVATLAGSDLLDQGFDLLYLTDQIDYNVDSTLQVRPHAELPMTGGRLLAGPW